MSSLVKYRQFYEEYGEDPFRWSQLIIWYREQLQYKQSQLQTGTSTYSADPQANSRNSHTEQLLSDMLDEMISENEVSKLSDNLKARYEKSDVKDKIIGLIKHPSKYPDFFWNVKEIS